MPQPLVVLVTCPDREKAAEIARALVEERLAACVNVVGEIRSIYRWEGKVCDEPEALCVIKTSDERFGDLRARILALHPYSTPEVIGFPTTVAHAPYVDWLLAQVAPL